MMHKLLALLFACLFSSLAGFANNHQEISPAFEKALKEFEKISLQLRHSGTHISEYLLRCSYVQDAWLTFLKEAENLEEYHNGMKLLEDHTRSFKSVCWYATQSLNFYTGRDEYANPQYVNIMYAGVPSQGYLNTFKTGRHLNQEERALYFGQEEANYLRDKVANAFTLDEATLNQIKEETIYNFVLLPDGKIRAALERPGQREYHVRDDQTVDEAFQYPNHTILAGGADQAVVTAGSFIFYKQGEKRLFFISCKSGHFQPWYPSLDFMKSQLSELGVDSSTVVCVADVNLSEVILKRYQVVQVPVAITKKDAEELFYYALQCWHAVYDEIDKKLLAALAQGNFEQLDSKLIATLSKQREEATYMRSAYRLFSDIHEYPKTFHKLVKSFGKLKDALKHEVPKQIEKEAAAMLDCMARYEEERNSFTFVPADDASFHHYLVGSVYQMKNLFEKDKLLIDDYHKLKKISREIGSLFFYLSQKAKFSEKRYFIYHALSENFFYINEMMGQTHDAYIAKVLREEVDQKEDYFVEIPQKLSQDLLNCCKHLGLLPLEINFEINFEKIAAIFNWAKGNWAIADLGLVKNKNVNSIIQEILTDNISWNEDKRDQFFSYLEYLKQQSEAMGNTMLLFDIKHAIPESLQYYLNNLNYLMEAFQDGRDFKENLSRLMNVKRSDLMLFLLEWECTDQPGFDETFTSCLKPLEDICENEVITLQNGKEMISRLRTFQDLMNLYMQGGRRYNLTAEKNHFPIVCFEVLEEHADMLITLIKRALEGKSSEITITALMEHHAQVILTRILKNNGN